MGGVPIRGTIFDLDGTLYALPCRKLRMALSLRRELGILRHLDAARRTLRGRTFGGAEELGRAQAEELARRSGLTPDEAARWYEERFLGGLTALLARRARLRPALPGLLADLRSAGVRCGVVSDFGRVAERLEAIGLGREPFDDVHSAEDFGVLKPSAAPFLALARKWGLESEAVLVVGDRVDLDADSARMAGMDFLGVRETRRAGIDDRGFGSWDSVASRLRERAGLRGEADTGAGESA